MKKITPLLCLSLVLAQLSQTIPARAAEEKPPLVQVALLLDTSNSMDGLIDQTKSQLWKIVNEFINAKQNGLRPELQVALYEYGQSTLSVADGYIRQILSFTTDLDKVSEQLFKLKTNGGEEYCGWVIKVATEKLPWSKSPKDFKAIFIAGNEPFTQGPVDYAQACKGAIEKGIIVNTIHCGDQATGISTKWQDGALLAEGKYMFIDHNRAVVHFEAPQDKEIAQLGAELNATYIAYGRAGQESQARQVAQDANASSYAASGSALNRALCKASDNYRNSNWDLVDACKDGRIKLPDLKKDELPVQMQTMTELQRKTYVESKAKARENIQQQINRLNADRTRYVAEEMKKHSNTNTLDAVMISAIREQARKKDYHFE
jgi:hypothetical protein